MRRKQFLLWAGWLTATIVMSAYFIWIWRSDDRTLLLPGATTHGHYQIEMDCYACHTPWMGVKEEACYECHAEELKLANDTHPKSKFTDPRNADRLANIDAANCVTCHREHVPDRTHPMGVTMPMDYCFHCHQQTLKDRASHANLPFDSCATAGCHNYHDNRALYTEFLLKHADEPAHKQPAVTPARSSGNSRFSTGENPPQKLTAEDQDGPDSMAVDELILRDWAATAHAAAGVNCSHCHTARQSRHQNGPRPVPRSQRAARAEDERVESGVPLALQSLGARDRARSGESSRPAMISGDSDTVVEAEGEADAWSDAVDYAVCARCHEEETAGFLAGRHGMRLAQGLSPMTPGMARLPMKDEAAHRELTCVSCHGAHDFNSRRAAVESCLECHNDSHSLAYLGSPHHVLWQQEQEGLASDGSGVSCATCHLPREKKGSGARTRVVVQHNQNDNLRPNEKMIRSVCLECHGLGFSIDSLADAALVQTNFTGQPARHVESIDMAVEWQMNARKTKTRN